MGNAVEEKETEEMAMRLYAEWRLQMEFKKLLMGTQPWEKLPYVYQQVWRAVARRVTGKCRVTSTT